MVRIKTEKMLDNWSMLIENGAGSAENVLQEMQKFLRDSDLPKDCEFKMEEVSAGLISKDRRPFLYATFTKFPAIKAYAGVRDWGSHLQVSRYITVQPTFVQHILGKIFFWRDSEARFKFSGARNVLEAEDLNAFASIFRKAVSKGVQSITKKPGQNNNYLEKQSEGLSLVENW